MCVCVRACVFRGYGSLNRENPSSVKKFVMGLKDCQKADIKRSFVHPSIVYL